MVCLKALNKSRRESAEPVRQNYAISSRIVNAVSVFFFSSRRRHTRYWRDWSSDVCSSDLPDIRFVVHYHFPGSLEAYYQEAGRAGRDGETSRCTVLYRVEDQAVQGYFLGGGRERGGEGKRGKLGGVRCCDKKKKHMLDSTS